MICKTALLYGIEYDAYSDFYELGDEYNIYQDEIIHWYAEHEYIWWNHYMSVNRYSSVKPLRYNPFWEWKKFGKKGLAHYHALLSRDDTPLKDYAL